MFQKFDDPEGSAASAERLVALRAELSRTGLHGFIVPRADEHQGEYVPAAAERLAWLTGFTGSAGTAVVLTDKAALFVDGRYTVQARRQTDPELFEIVFTGQTTPAAWLRDAFADSAAEPAEIGYDPWLMTRAQVERFDKALAGRRATLVPVEENPLDAVWTGRPAPPDAKVVLHPTILAGHTAARKIADLQESLAEKDVDAAVLTDPASIAWTFNIRGGDVPHTPYALAFAILRRTEKPALFVDSAKLSNAVRAELEEIADIRPIADFSAALESLGAAEIRTLYDPASAAEAVALAIERTGGTVVDGDDPARLPKAIKTEAELVGSRAAHFRDGAAVAKFLYWLHTEGPSGALTEIAIAKKLEALRAAAGRLDGMDLQDISFDTIAGAGPNGAIVHYRVTERTDRSWQPGELLLVDSGAQFCDGTTDITRTVLAGVADIEDLTIYRDRFTRVLKGHIAIATACFPAGTTGAQLDALARSALWRAGLDYDHGTGHGVGAFLSVHEGPQRIAKTGHTELRPGMIISNEPGYYAEDRFGIRIENLVAVREAGPVPGGDRDMLSLETLTLAPIARNLIAIHLLTPVEIAWLDLYHARVFAALSGWPDLTGAERNWLAGACRPVGGS